MRHRFPRIYIRSRSQNLAFTRIHGFPFSLFCGNKNNAPTPKYIASSATCKEYTIYMDYHSLHGLSQFTWTITVYMDYHNLHGLSQFTWTITIYMDYHNLHGLSQFTWTITVYMDYHSLHGLSQLKACLLVVIADGSCVRVRS